MRKLIYFVASSIDGFIAREDGSVEDFSMDGEHFADLLAEFPETIPGHLREQLGVSAPNKRFDAVIMGRRTYEVGLQINVTNPYPHLKQYVVSRSFTASPDKNVELVSDNPLEFARLLKLQEGKDIWLCGGGELASALLPEIDEMILKINPFLMGTGIPIVAGHASTKLELLNKNLYDNGFMLLHYLVKH